MSSSAPSPRGPGDPYDGSGSVATLGAAVRAPARRLRAREDGWALLTETIECSIEVAVAAQLFGIHRRIAEDTGMAGLPQSRRRIRDAGHDVLRRSAVAHATLARGGHDWFAAVARQADVLVASHEHDLDEALRRLPVRLGRELAAALDERGDEDGDPGPAIAGAAAAALALCRVTA